MEGNQENKIRKIISRTSIYHTAANHLIYNNIENAQKEGKI